MNAGRKTVTGWYALPRYQPDAAQKWEFWRRCLIYFGVYFLFIIPIIKANYFYIDDLGRNLYGYARWSLAGRPFASLLMEALNFNRWIISDLAPLPQLLAIALLAIASAWTSICFRLRSGIEMMPVALIVCDPFFLENLSYRFDSLTMSMAVFLAMLPVALNKTLNGVALHGSVCFAVFSMLNLYQPAINVFLVLSFFSALIALRSGAISDALYRLLANLACFAAAMIAYKLEIIIFHFDNYASSHSQLISLGALPELLGNLKAACAVLAKNLLHTHQTQIIVAAMLLGLLAWFAGLPRSRTSGDFLVKTPVSVCLILGMLASMIGPLALLATPVWAPRVLMGFGAASACLLALLVLESQDTMFRPCALAIVVIVLFAEFTISYAYGNALRAQAAYEGHIANDIAEDAYRLAGTKPALMIVDGMEPEAPAVRLVAASDPVIKFLLPLPLRNSWYWGGIVLRLHGLPSNIKFKSRTKPAPPSAEIMAAASTHGSIRRIYYTMYQNRRVLLVDFNKGVR
jgi:hypothetical protein